MKIYALRIEKPETVIGCLASNIITPNKLKTAYDKFILALVDAIHMCLREPVKVELHSFTQLEKQKSAKLNSTKKYLNFDSQSKLGIPFGVSRRFNYVTSKQIDITSRPGFDELVNQSKQVIALYGNEFGILEDDVYTGSTLKFMIDFLEKQGMVIHSVITGVSSTQLIDSHYIDTCVYYQPDDLLELTDPRDYIFGAKQGGLVVSLANKKFRVPYCAPFVNIAARSSIAPEKTSDFSKYVTQANIQLLADIGSLNLKALLFFPNEFFEYHNIEKHLSLEQLLNWIEKVV